MMPANMPPGAFSPSAATAERLLVVARERQPGALADPLVRLALPDPDRDALSRALGSAADPPEGPLWLVGGEPTLRPDLPALIAHFAAKRELGLVTDGLALMRPRAIEPLVAAGLSAARIWLHAARRDAHDWLVGLPGAAKGALRAVEALRASGVRCELAALLTRPTIAYVDELVLLCAELGLAQLTLQRLPTPATEAAGVMLVPRQHELVTHLGRAAEVARRTGVSLRLVDLPRCATGDAAHARVADEPLRWPADPAWSAARETLTETHAPCGDCPGAPVCHGMAASHVARFGWAQPAATSPIERVRIRFGGPAVVACPTCGDHQHAMAEPEPTRAIRLRLVQAARLGGSDHLRIADAASLSHPAAPELLREAMRLFPSVAIAGEGSALGAMDDAALYLLRGLSRVDAALYGPDAASHDAHVGRPGAFEATLTGLRALERIAEVPVGMYAVMHPDDDAIRAEFVHAWRRGELVGEPRFRAEAASDDPVGCLFQDRFDAAEPPSGSDVYARRSPRSP
jgi:MoaA/NifB/PqqE/SkfB family radical SAM enzyme